MKFTTNDTEVAQATAVSKMCLKIKVNSHIFTKTKQIRMLSIQFYRQDLEFNCKMKMKKIQILNQKSQKNKKR